MQWAWADTTGQQLGEGCCQHGETQGLRSRGPGSSPGKPCQSPMLGACDRMDCCGELLPPHRGHLLLPSAQRAESGLSTCPPTPQGFCGMRMERLQLHLRLGGAGGDRFIPSVLGKAMHGWESGNQWDTPQARPSCFVAVVSLGVLLWFDLGATPRDAWRRTVAGVWV